MFPHSFQKNKNMNTTNTPPLQISINKLLVTKELVSNVQTATLKGAANGRSL